MNEKAGSGAGLAAVAAAQEGRPGDDRGFLINPLGPSGGDDGDHWNGFTHYATEELSLDLSAGPPSSFSVDALLSQPDEARFTARVDGRWFATKEAFRPEASEAGRMYDDFATKAVTHTLDVAGAAWIPFSFLPGTTMGLDTAAGAVALPEGTLDAAGLLLQPTGHEAFDNFTISVSPGVLGPG